MNLSLITMCNPSSVTFFLVLNDREERKKKQKEMFNTIYYMIFGTLIFRHKLYESIKFNQKYNCFKDDNSIFSFLLHVRLILFTC